MSKNIKNLGPDAKSQVTVKYKGNIAQEIETVILSIQHDASYSQDDIKEVINPIIKESFGYLPNNIHINPTGQFIIGGPDGDAGLTGRKIIVDTYGGAAPHGGGAFSGKDPTKVDRSAAYMARYIAKNIVAAKIANACTIQLSYAIGMQQPTSLYINTHGTSSVNEDQIIKLIENKLDLRPQAIIEYLKLANPIYGKTAKYGHFGKEYDSKNGYYSWEKLDLIETLQQLL